MENNVLFLFQNWLTVSPLLVGGLIFFLLITDKIKNELILVCTLFTFGVFLGLISLGLLQIGIFIVLMELTIATIYAIFRNRKG